MLHLQRQPAERPFEALEVGDEAGVAEIANVHVALFDLPVLEVDLLLQVPNLKLQSLQVGGGCHAGPTAGVGRKKKTRQFLPWVIGSYNGVFSSQRKSIAAHSPSAHDEPSRELAV